MSSNKNPYFLPIGNSGMMKKWIADNVDIPAIKHCHTAGVPMDPGTGVYMATDGKIYPYVTGSEEVYLGILESPGYTGKAATVQYAGYLSFEGSGWTAGVPYYMTPGGGLVANDGDFLAAVGVGKDAIVVLSGASGQFIEPKEGVYFVDKRYSGYGGAYVSGLTPADITSSNTSYMKQLENAVPGSTMRPFPDPWSARNQALSDLLAGKTNKVSIVVLSGQWLVGSNDPNQNGTSTGSAPNVGAVADIGFAANDLYTSSLMADKIEYWFDNGTKLIYINSNYNIPFVYVFDQNDNAYFSSITGHLTLQYVYGKRNPIYSVTYSTNVFVIDNAAAKLKIELENMYNRPWRLFDVYSVEQLDVKIKYLEAVDNIIANFKPNRDVPSGYCNVNMEFGSILIKPNTTDADWWSMFYLSGNNLNPVQNTKTNINIKIGNITATQSFDAFDAFLTLPGATGWNTNISVDVKNAKFYNGQTNRSGCALLSMPYNGSRNLNVNLNFDNLLTEVPITREITLNTKSSFNSYSTDENTIVRVKVGSGRKLQNATLNTAVPTAKYALVHRDSAFLSPMGGGAVHVEANLQSEEPLLYTEWDGTSCTYTVSGILRVINGATKPVVILDRYLTNQLSLVDCVLSNDGFTWTIDNGSTYPTQANSILIKNVMGTANANPTYITPVGESITVSAALTSYIR